MSRKITNYADANLRLLREAHVRGVGPASTVDFAHFMSRNKCVVRAVHVRLSSAASAAGGSIHVARRRNAPSNTSIQTLGTETMVSATSAGTSWSYTLTTNNTLTSLKDVMVLNTTGACDQGKFDVVYEYQLLSELTVEQ